MDIDWRALLMVGIVSLAVAVAVVVLVAFALVGLSARSGAARHGGEASALSAGVGTAAAWVCLVATVAIVGFGLYLVVV
jgi:hypothetical protein